MKRFKIKSNGDPYHEGVKNAYFWVYVFDEKRQMFDWYLKYAEQREKESGVAFDRSLTFDAVNMPFERWQVVNGELNRMHDNIGIILFSKKHINPGIVAHEMGHAAMWYERLINENENAEFGADNNSTEERYLYLIHDFVNAFYKKASKLNLL